MFVLVALGLCTATAVGAGYYLQTDAEDGTETIAWGGMLEHELQKGETIDVIALAYGVHVEDLYAWNNTREFKPGDKIAIYTRDASTGSDELTDGIQIQSALAELEMQVKEGVSTKKKAPKGSKQKYIPMLAVNLTVSGPPAAPAPQVGGGAAPKAPSFTGKVQTSADLAYLETLRDLKNKADLSKATTGKRVKSKYSSGSTGDAARAMFAADDDRAALAAKSDAWQAGHSNGNARPASAPESSGSVSSGYTSGGSVGGSAPSVPRLAMPAAKKCLAGPSDVGSGAGVTMASSAGLSEPQIRSTMSSFVPKALSCVSGASSFNGTVETEMTVGCDGRVKSVSIERNDGVPSAVASCLRDTLKYASFPAHDMPDGYTFGYKVNVAR